MGFPVRRTRPRATRASPGKSSFRHAFPTWLRCEKGKEEGGFGATAAGPRVIRFRARAHQATPASLIDDDHHLHIGPGRVIRLRRELVLSLGLFVRDPKYVAHEPRPLHCYLGSERLAALPSLARRGARARSVASARMTRPDPRLAASRARAVVFAFRGQRLERLFEEAKAKGHLRLARKPNPRFAESGGPVDRVNRRAKLTTERSPRRVAA